MNLKVKVIYKNKELKPIQECEYSLNDYTDMLSLDMKRIISDVEDIIYQCNGNKPKDEWSEDEMIAFNRIKHKILDKAGEISRIPNGIYDADAYEGNVASFWDKLFR